MIRAYGLTKRYGTTTVVQDLDFTVRPGSVTGFLGPNGAGKSTTMRMLLGLDAPTRGCSTIGGRAYAAHSAPPPNRWSWLMSLCFSVPLLWRRRHPVALLGLMAPVSLT